MVLEEIESEEEVEEKEFYLESNREKKIFDRLTNLGSYINKNE